MSSAVSSSSHGSGQDDADALGDVYMWGEGAGDGILGGGIHRVAQGPGGKLDALVPKAMESTLVLDVQYVACGGRHAGLVTKQGEVFCWGEESGGRLGHGIYDDVRHPQLIENLANTNVELVTCGEYHSCAVTFSGEMYTWGDGMCGLLGHSNEVSHWVPKRLGGPLEGLHVSSVSCGTWHTALVTSSGKLFTFGEGTFGVLGHGDRSDVLIPKEVDSLKGSKTVRVACGVWHTAAIVDVMVGPTASSLGSSGKLFTWGDGDKGRLGHGDKEQKLVPICVGALVNHSLYQVACGHSLTVVLTDSGQVYTMGSSVYGQLGDPKADGKYPGRVQGELRDAFVNEISAGAFHVAVLTSKSDVYTWGKGANGRLGHGDVADRDTPTLVKGLKNKQVKAVACGSGFTMAIGLHKWVSGSNHSTCSGCKQLFGFTRKRHNCYNCGLVFCHACSSKKALKASMAPNPIKPSRICNPCCVKLKKAADNNTIGSTEGNTRVSISSWQGDTREKQGEISLSQFVITKSTGLKQLKQNESKFHSKRNRRSEVSNNHGSPAQNGMRQYPAFKPSTRRLVSASVPHSRIVSKASSPVPSRRPSPPRLVTPYSNLMGMNSSQLVAKDIRRTNEALEIIKLKSQVETLTRRCQLQDAELKNSSQQLHEAVAIAGEETSKCKAAKEVTKSLIAQLKAMAEQLPGDCNHCDRLGTVPIFRTNSASSVASLRLGADGLSGPIANGNNLHDMYGISHGGGRYSCNGTTYQAVSDGPIYGSIVQDPSLSSSTDDRLNAHLRSDNGLRDVIEHEVGMEWVEQDEQGVYITFVSLPEGRRHLKRVRFSRRRFSEKQAELWWQQNKARVHEHYNVRPVER